MNRGRIYDFIQKGSVSLLLFGTVGGTVMLGQSYFAHRKRRLAALAEHQKNLQDEKFAEDEFNQLDLK
ncbi:hypothetical protein SPOG_00007 [Schizosaccharomyces cryophilus OY26]|uniref:Cytochrome c oxidase assembly protein n=1 Tax=Schizosaccharomyces cryophilus (strain OY26 / ATCC MYA-4695 / CBS 11777 / NBRC 106824 / NRRL Y48691) TaxID=653667 RepID=S9XCJ6_SCHCR|nr:uncharacterized protein SPOG_00007 [Schizosaccharomyces cryophilus OY26]EPY51581.1 hypothetical protein SPOG_00007 [Schizosaccharomyces cryophilus OY26]